MTELVSQKNQSERDVIVLIKKKPHLKIPKAWVVFKPNMMIIFYKSFFLLHSFGTIAYLTRNITSGDNIIENKIR